MASQSESTEWVLIQREPKDADRGLGPGFSEIRNVSTDEVNDIDLANRTILTFGPSWTYNRILQQVEAFRIRLSEAEAAIKLAKAINDSDRRQISVAFSEILATFNAWLDSASDESNVDGLKEHPDPDQVSDARSSVQALQVAKKLQEVSPDQVCVIAMIEDVVGISQVRIAPEATERVGFPPGSIINAVAILVEVHIAANRVAAQILLRNKDQISTATRKLLGIAAEALVGDSALIRSEQMAQMASRSSVTLNFKEVAVDRARGLMHSLRISEKILATEELGTVPDHSTSSSDRVEIPTDPEHTSDETGPVEVSPAEAALSEAPATSLASLVSEATTLADEIERSWSSALGDQMNDISNSFARRAESLALSLARIIQHDESAPGATPLTIPSFPLSVDHVDMLRNSSADIPTRALQFAISQLHLAQQLLAELETLNSPFNARIDLTTGNEISWWSSGAFDRFRRVGQSSLHLEQHEAIDTDSPSIGHLMLEAQHLSDAIEVGLFEGGLVYAQRAVRLISELGLTLRTNATESVDNIDAAVSVLDDAVKEHAYGGNIARRVAIPLAHLFNRLITGTLQTEMDRMMDQVYITPESPGNDDDNG